MLAIAIARERMYICIYSKHACGDRGIFMCVITSSKQHIYLARMHVWYIVILQEEYFDNMFQRCKKVHDMPSMSMYVDYLHDMHHC